MKQRPVKVRQASSSSIFLEMVVLDVVATAGLLWIFVGLEMSVVITGSVDVGQGAVWRRI